MGIVSTGGDVRLLEAERLQQYINYAEAVKQKKTFEGYDIERLKLVATLLEQQSITPEDLRKLVDNLVFAMETVVIIATKTQEITQTCLRHAAIAEAELKGKEGT
ncbi:hypothetical protein SDC9_74200 [bioreactor metagenome]|uniref:Uncharacterized protein n=1 Tax=bioreactor metagenome TaxID=1076179 RepID=A0A644YHD9_9ZZZZ